MSRVVEHIAELTAFRDREVLDVSMVTALKDLLALHEVAIYRCVGEAGAQHWLTRARLAQGEIAATADPLWSDLESLPTLASNPERLACLLSQETRVVPAGANFTTCFALTNEQDGVGVLEIQSARAMGVEDLRLVSGLLRIYRNFQSILDYSERDTLTGLLNRRTFDESFLRIAVTPLPASADPGGRRRAIQETGSPPALTAEPSSGGIETPVRSFSSWLGVIDIDHFKRVNDRFGHLIGDEVLLLISRLMRTGFRGRDHLYRFGGEEFVVLMRCASGADAGAVFERLRKIVEIYDFPQVGTISISVGFTEVRPGDTPNTAFERADQALYHAKQNGRNQVRNHATLVAEGLLADTARSSDIELF